VAQSGVAVPGLLLQLDRELARTLGYGFFDLCEHAWKKLMGGDAKNHLACERSLQVRLPGQPLKARYFRTALASNEKSHLILREAISFPVGPEIAHNPGCHKSSGRPGRAEPCGQFQPVLTRENLPVRQISCCSDATFCLMSHS
jgi:hypothetical protein